MPFPGKDPEEKNDGNVASTGFFLFMNDDVMVWPRSVEIEGGPDSGLFHAGNISGYQSESTLDQQARAKAMKPDGEWNQVEIVSRDGKIFASLNGLLVTTVTQHEGKEPGHIGLQCESTEVHFRNIRIRPEY